MSDDNTTTWPKFVETATHFSYWDLDTFLAKPRFKRLTRWFPHNTFVARLGISEQLDLDRATRASLRLYVQTAKR